MRLVENAVDCVSQTYVDTLKKQGKFDAEAQKNAYNQAVEAITKLMDDDELLFVHMLSENATMVMRSKKEMFLRIDCATIPEKKKAAVGVRGMRLDREDELTDIYLLNDQEEKEVEVKGKQVALHRLHIANRDTKGVKK